MINPTKLVAYTDGSCDQNGTSRARGGYGVVILTPDGQELKRLYNAKPLPGVTNNEMELLAVGEALTYIEETWPGAAVEIRTDSQLVIGWCSQGWKRKAPNTWPYLESIDALMQRLKVTFTKVRGHSGDRYNDEADRLAGLCLV